MFSGGKRQVRPDRVLRRVWIALALWLTAPLCPGAERLSVYTVNYPLQYFAQRIAGELADVVLPVPPGLDPAFWEPDPAAIADLQKADLILLNGADYAAWISRVSLPRRKLANTSAGFRDRWIAMAGGPRHSHGLEGEHSHAGTAFTTWLDMSLAVEQAAAIRDALTRLMPEAGDSLAGNFAGLERDLLELDRQLQAVADVQPGMVLIASHPVYQYLARRYGLDIRSLVWEPDEVPPEQEWRHLQALREAHPADWMLWEGGPLPEVAERLKSQGMGSVLYDPVANRPAAGDFLSVMTANVHRLLAVFGEDSGRP